MKSNYQIGDLVIGTVVNVKPYALFMQFDENVSGLLHISEISDGYISDIEKFGTVGDSIKVKILSIDDKNGFLRVSYKKVPKEEMYSTHCNENHTLPKVNKSSFETLEKNLPQWINATLKKVENKDD